MYDYRSTDLAGAAHYALLADGFDCLDEPSLAELAEDEAEVRAVFEEVYGPAGAVADLPF